MMAIFVSFNRTFMELKHEPEVTMRVRDIVLIGPSWN